MSDRAVEHSWRPRVRSDSCSPRLPRHRGIDSCGSGGSFGAVVYDVYDWLVFDPGEGTSHSLADITAALTISCSLLITWANGANRLHGVLRRTILLRIGQTGLAAGRRRRLHVPTRMPPPTRLQTIRDSGYRQMGSGTDQHAGSSTQTNADPQVQENADPFVKGLQKMLNQARKLDGRMRRAHQDLQLRESQWTEFQEQLRNSFLSQRHAYQEDKARLETLRQALQTVHNQDDLLNITLSQIAGRDMAAGHPSLATAATCNTPQRTATAPPRRPSHTRGPVVQSGASVSGAQTSRLVPFPAPP